MNIYNCKKCGYVGNTITHNRKDGVICNFNALEYKAFGNTEANKVTDPVVEAVRKDLLDRSTVGIEKYGTTLADNKCSLRDKLQHAYEECLDQANYLKWAITQLDNTQELHDALEDHLESIENYPDQIVPMNKTRGSTKRLLDAFKKV